MKQVVKCFCGHSQFFSRRMLNMPDTKKVGQLLVLGNETKEKKSNHKANTDHKAITNKSQSKKVIPSFGLQLLHTCFLWT